MSALTDLHETIESSIERNTKGQFKTGNKGGPGNPFAGQVSLLRKAVLECVTTEDLNEIVKGLIQMAKDGHWQAAKLILAYAIGKPGSLPEPSGLDELALAHVNHPSTNGILPTEPLTNGPSREPSPSANGTFPTPAEPVAVLEAASRPSANGSSPPALNRKQRRAQRKAERIAKKIGNPSANGLSTAR